MSHPGTCATAEKTAEQKTTHSLYRHFDADGKLLYVGISVDAMRRLSQHKQSRWHQDIASVTIEKFGSREDALDAEAWAIAQENPMHNRHRPITLRRDGVSGDWTAMMSVVEPPFVVLNTDGPIGPRTLERAKKDQMLSERLQRELWIQTLTPRESNAYLAYLYESGQFEGDGLEIAA